jgi:hypothetical protein
MIITSFLIPSTSKGFTWTKPTDCYLFNTLNSIFITMPLKGHEFRIYVGVDSDDPFYTSPDIRNFFINNYKNLQFVDIVINVDMEKGHLTKMWNILAKKSYEEGTDYMFQCGDDIEYHYIGWVDECVKVLQKHNNIGMTGPFDVIEKRIFTQTFVHKTHWEIFGFYFPEEIKNWFCDDWINEVYPKIIIDGLTCRNTGGKPRYNIVVARDLCTQLVQRDRKVLAQYMVKKFNISK